MPFEFIDNASPLDGASRRRIRCHVAAGKNAGRTLNRPSRRKASAHVTRSGALWAARDIRREDGRRGEERCEEERVEEWIPRIERRVGNVLSVVSFPEQRGAKARIIVQRAFSFINGARHAPELSNAVDTSDIPTSLWVQFMFLDEAYFHCAVATSVTALNLLLTTPENPSAALHHLSRTFRLVNQKLSSAVDALADTTIAVVVIMAQHERLQGQYESGLVHVGGLLRMVELRGGIVEIARERPSLAQKVFRLDLEYALHLGTLTRFSVEDILPSSTAMLGFPNDSREQAHPNTLPSCLAKRLNPALHALLLDFIDLSHLLNSACDGTRAKLNGYAFHDTLLLLGYRLLAIRPLSRRRSLGSSLEEVVHLGLTAFIVSFLLGLDRRIPHIPVLSEMAREVARGGFDGDGDGEDKEVMLWILFLGSTSMFKPVGHEWLVPKTMRMMRDLGSRTWEDVGRVLGKFPWVNNVHDKAGRELWDRAISSDGVSSVMIGGTLAIDARQQSSESF